MTTQLYHIYNKMVFLQKCQKLERKKNKGDKLKQVQVVTENCSFERRQVYLTVYGQERIFAKALCL